MFYLVFGAFVAFVITVIANFAIYMAVLNHFKHQHDIFSRANLLNYTPFFIISTLHIYRHWKFCGQCKMCFWPFWSIFKSINMINFRAHWLGCSQYLTVWSGFGEPCAIVIISTLQIYRHYTFCGAHFVNMFTFKLQNVCIPPPYSISDWRPDRVSTFRFQHTTCVPPPLTMDWRPLTTFNKRCVYYSDVIKTKALKKILRKLN